MLKQIYTKADVHELVTTAHGMRNFKNTPIVTINGCFDLPTAGHLNILKAARNQAYFIGKNGIPGLVVCGLNSDSSVKKLKGEKRPIMNQMERANFLLATGFVDVVYIYDEETSEEFVRLLKPNVHVNDASYGENCVEASVLREYSKEIKSRLFLVDKVGESCSTTELIERILERYGCAEDVEQSACKTKMK